jgi:hypothetical protein
MKAQNDESIPNRPQRRALVIKQSKACQASMQLRTIPMQRFGDLAAVNDLV